MSIFQKSVINKYLANVDKNNIQKAYETFKARYTSVRIEEIKRMKEEEYQDGFLRELFADSLGYTIKPSDNYNLVREFKNQTDSRKVDGAIIKDGKAIAVIELKSTKTKDLTSITDQAFNYKNNQPDCKYVITSNFQKLRFYIDYSNEYEEFDLFSLSRESFELLYLILSKESIFSDIPVKLKKETLFHDEKISKQLYKDYSVFKNNLFSNLVKNNTEQNRLVLFKKSQKLIDRFLFILFAEDRGLLPPNSISRIIQRFETLRNEDAYKPVYEIFKQYFGYMNVGRKGQSSNDDIPAYNGGLFYPDETLDNLKIDDEIIIEDLRRMSVYDYNTEVDVNILGHIFEHSLTEIEEITAEIEGIEKDKSKSKRKKDGVFYTPKYITQYIVENTIGALCEEKRKELGIYEIEIDESYLTKDRKLSAKGNKLSEKLNEYKNWLLSLKIVDPACGSGAFLNQALNFLINEHQFVIDMEIELQQGQSSLFSIETAILENNLYGVDINEESVEIAKLSLWLRTAQKGRKLSVLSNNIKCGNSLIDDPEVAGEKAFNWEKEFPEVFAKGGFDVVIGNPPYGATFSEQEKECIKKKYRSYQYKFESYLYFYEKGVCILKEKKRLSFITPELFLRLEKSENIRRFLMENTKLIELKFYGENVFSDVKVNTVVLTLEKNLKSDSCFRIVSENGFSWIYEFRKWENAPQLKIDYEISPQVEKIIEKIENCSKCVGDFGEAIQGLTPYDSYRGHSKELIEKRGFHFYEKVDETCGKWLDGENVGRYSLIEGLEWLKYGDWLAAPRDKKFFEGPRLLFREVPGQNKRIQATYTDIQYFHGHSITPFIINQSESKDTLFEILGIVNSKLISWFAKYKSSNFSKNMFPKLNPKDIKQLPISKIILEGSFLTGMVKQILKNQDEFIILIKKFSRYLQSQIQLELFSKNLQNWYELEFGDFVKELNKEIKKSGREKLTKMGEMEWMEIFETKKAEVQNLRNEIDRTDKEIDKMVYKLYGLTPEEIEIVEGSLK